MVETLGEVAARYVSELGFALIPLKSRDKVPVTKHGLKDWSKDADDVRQGFGARPHLNMGVVLGEPSGNVVVIDIDVDDDKGYDGYDSLRAWEREHGELPETVTALTGRGGIHLYYRVDRIVHPSTNDELHIDIRGEGSYVVVPPSIHANGKPYYWENDPEDYAIADADENVYAFIEHVQGGQSERKKFRMPTEIKPGKRNDTLFRYGCSLQAQDFDDDMVAASMEAMNNIKCKPPLEQDELEKIIESVLACEKGLSKEAMLAKAKKSQGSGGSEFNHASFADMMIAEDHVCFIDGAPAIWQDNHYAIGKRYIEAAMIRHKHQIKARNRVEVYKYLELQAPHVKMADKRYIAFSNVVLDIKTMQTMDISPSLHIPNVIPHRWNPEAESSVLGTMLQNIARGDPAVIANLLEVIGLCMYRGTELATCPILFGRGQNGKSTYLNLIHRILGDENVSSLDVSTIGERFQTVPLMGKLANIGDDISNEFVSGNKASVVKKVITGDYIQAEYKGGDTFEFRPYCTLVFSCNDFPRIGDSSYGMIRRLHPVPFNAQFKVTDPGYNPNIEQDLATENAIECAIVLGIYALKEALEKKQLTNTEGREEQIENIKLNNSTVYQFASSELGYGEEGQRDINGCPTGELFEEYLSWCEKNHIRTPVYQNKFSTEIKDIYHMDISRIRIETTGGRKQVRAFTYPDQQ